MKKEQGKDIHHVNGVSVGLKRCFTVYIRAKKLRIYSELQTRNLTCKGVTQAKQDLLLTNALNRKQKL